MRQKNTKRSQKEEIKINAIKKGQNVPRTKMAKKGRKDNGKGPEKMPWNSN